MALKGDFAKLRMYVDKVERLGSPESMQSLTDNLAEEAIDLVVEGMQDETDPYGKRHKPKVFGDGRSVLVGRTTRLLRGWHRVRSDGRGFKITSGVGYAKYHQQGTGIYGPRKQKIVPKNGKSLAFFAEGFVTSGAKARQKGIWAASLGPKTRAGSAKKGFDKAIGKIRGSMIFVRSVKGCPPRKMVPDKNGLPQAWGDAFSETATVWFRKNFRSSK